MLMPMRPVTNTFPVKLFPMPVSPTITTCGFGNFLSSDHGLKNTGRRLAPDPVHPRNTPVGVPITPELQCRNVDSTSDGRLTNRSSSVRCGHVGRVACQAVSWRRVAG